MTVEAFTEQLAEDLDEDAEEIRSRAEDIVIAAPWKGKIESPGDDE